MQLSDDPTTRQTQLAAIKTYVEANFSVNGAGVYDQSTANAMNAAATPTFYVWKKLSSLENTGMAIDLKEVNGLTTAESSRLDVSFQIRPNGFLPFKQSDRAFFGNLFSATGGTVTRPALLSEWQRAATIAEKVLASGTGTQATDIGTDGTVSGGSPATLGDGASGNITVSNLLEAEANG